MELQPDSGCLITYPNPKYVPGVSKEKKRFAQKQVRIGWHKANMTTLDFKHIVGRRIKIDSSKWTWNLDSKSKMLIRGSYFGNVQAKVSADEEQKMAERAARRMKKKCDAKLKLLNEKFHL